MSSLDIWSGCAVHSVVVVSAAHGKRPHHQPPQCMFISSNCHQGCGVDRTGRDGLSHLSQHNLACCVCGVLAVLRRSWHGYDAELTDPLADSTHSLQHEAWRGITSAGK